MNAIATLQRRREAIEIARILNDFAIPLTVEEISQLAKLPRIKCKRRLYILKNENLATTLPGKPLRWISTKNINN